MKNRLVKIKSSDGEIHFQECRANWCSDYPQYDSEQARNIAKKEAKKPLMLNKRTGDEKQTRQHFLLQEK